MRLNTAFLASTSACALTLCTATRAQSCFDAPHTSPSTTQPFLIASADMNGDGRPDVVVSSQSGAPVSSGHVQVLLNLATGVFAGLGAATTGSAYGSLALADFDGDGDVDVATPSTDGLYVFPNIGGGSLWTPTVVPWGPPWTLYVAGCACGDFDGDGDIDIVVAHPSGNRLLLFQNNGGMSFSAPIAIGVGNSPSSVALVDLDGDGDLDIVAARNNAGLVTVCLNLGSGNPGVPVEYGVGSFPTGLVCADLNGDGLPEIVTTDSGAHTLSVLANLGGGSFAPAQAYGAGINLLDPRAIDADRDGDLDIVVVHDLSSSFSVLFNDGTGALSRVDYGAGSATHGLCCADFDLDGSVDLAFTNPSGNLVDAVYNCTAQWSRFCAGDGTLAACPCANNGLAGRGCQNSGSTGGAGLQAGGGASLQHDTLLLATQHQLDSLSIVLQGSASIAPVAFGDGLRCVGGSLKRLYVHTASGGALVVPQTGDASVSLRSAALGDTLAGGMTRYYQVYYRDPQLGFCAAPQGDSWNVSAGVSVFWVH